MPADFNSGVSRREFDLFRGETLERLRIIDERQTRISTDFGDLKATCISREDYTSRHDGLEERMRSLELSHSLQIGQIKSLKWITALLAPVVTALLGVVFAQIFHIAR